MSSIQLKTKIPGPSSIALMERRRHAVSRGPFHSTPLFIKKAHGSVIEDVDGNKLLDFGSGIGVTNLGHTPKAISEKIKKQADEVLHGSFNILPHESYVELCEKLCEITPGKFPKKAFLANSGAEAVENAIKFARAYTKRPAVVCFEHGFHGRTYMAMAMTSKVKPYRYGFGPYPSDVYRVPFPYTYRWSGMDDAKAKGAEECVAGAAFAQMTNIIHNQIGADQVACIVIEPVLGEGGFVPAPKEFLEKCIEFCKTNGILFVADEIQSGFGRTGAFSACARYGIEPDLITYAKGLGSGMPISAVVGRAEILDAPIEGGVGGTYGGNPLSCVSALEVIHQMKEKNFFAGVEKISTQIRIHLEKFESEFDFIGDVRGLGAMQAIEIVKSRKTKEPDKERVGRIMKYSYEHGLVILSSGTFGNVIRLLMPVNINEAELNEGMQILHQALKNS